MHWGKVTRLADKLGDLAKQGGQIFNRIGKEAIGNIGDLVAWIRRHLDEAIESLKNGRFVEWLRKKMHQFGLYNVAPKKLINVDWLWENLSGTKMKWKKLKWPKEIKSLIQQRREALEKRRIALGGELDIDSLGPEFELKVAEEVMKHTELTEFSTNIFEFLLGKKKGDLLGDIDIGTKDYWIETKKKCSP